MSFFDVLRGASVEVSANEPMSKHTTLGIGGPADWYAEIGSVQQLKAVVSASKEHRIPLTFIGAGSNLLVSDDGVAGMVIRLRGEFESITFSGHEVRAGAAVFLPTLVKLCAEKGLGGAEPLVGVPGTVGGALAMNAGTRDLEIGAIVKSAEILSMESPNALKVLTVDQIRFQYRSSSLNGEIVCFATLKLQAKSKDDIMRSIQTFLSRRLQTQPIGTMNVGSIFKNPQGQFSAELIEKAGLKGFKKGDAQVSPKHANFIVNCGGATANDVKTLIHEIQETILKKFGVRLEPEVKMIGR